MEGIGILVVLATLGGLAVLVTLALFYVRRGAQMDDDARGLQAIAPEARLEAGERLASLTAEQVEGIVRTKLVDYLRDSQTTLDFGPAPDGGLAFWVNGAAYPAPDDIPDQTIREAIREAVAQLNRG
ncbi:MAG: hypothetical protein IT326_07255 [Anaerolineae bacterium]|nr:hypothetical protein [Anaerolineae bacterium]